MQRKINPKRQVRELLQVIKVKCKEDCCAGDKESWVNCNMKDCSLYNYRLGKVLKKNEDFIKEKTQKSVKTTILVEGCDKKEVLENVSKENGQ